MLLDLTHPVMNVLVRLLVSNIVGHDDAVSTLVVRGCDSLEALLSSSIPDLEFNLLSINFNSLNFEVNPDGGHEVIGELVIGKTHQ
jgi:hypothetical protein